MRTLLFIVAASVIKSPVENVTSEMEWKKKKKHKG